MIITARKCHQLSAIDASNSHDVEGILVCFSDNATVRDENETLHGKQSIKGWIIRTIEKYQFHFEPLKIQHDDDCDVEMSDHHIATGVMFERFSGHLEPTLLLWIIKGVLQRETPMSVSQ